MTFLTSQTTFHVLFMMSQNKMATVVYKEVQWNLSYLGPGVVHKSEKSIPLKLCINRLKMA